MSQVTRRAVLVIALLFVLNRVAAQSPAFDAASIVPSAPGERVSYRVTPSGIFYTNAPLADCLQAAYQVSRFDVSGPEWLGRRRFDITARSVGPATKEQLMLMLQTLLAERFAVRLHREPREMSALALIARRGGPRLIPGDPNGLTDIIAGSNGTDLKNHTMLQLAHYLSRLPIGLPVVDKTAIDGRYDVHLDLAALAAGKKPGAGAAGDQSLVDPPTTIVNDALRPYGLELQPRKLPVEVIVIDEAQRDPTPN
jgi:uncharacterized protein (TIGR03435 family)